MYVRAIQNEKFFNGLSDMHVYPLPQITICDKKARKWANGPLKKIKQNKKYK